ncbi:hypothetical protein [Polyangium mundeleinium]|uniref:Uncharacterized protein n=1 Tax=Polyangium mundeleinium TaxID=2995306 RepID=A0ABT5EQF2_9BACT|nr:hypothetical protein [Polyangium mundeleinium]MDC0743127.1 hypothetical protein [Polyangium mundeleinium]
MHEADEHEAHVERRAPRWPRGRSRRTRPPHVAPWIYAAERGHGRETSGKILTLAARRAASMHEADEHEAHPPPHVGPRIYAVERGHGRETSGKISTLAARRAASMHEADEHEAHPPPTSGPRIYAVERGHGRETSGKISTLAARRAASMPEADEHEAHVEPEADELGPASTRRTSSAAPLNGPGVGRDAPAPHVEPADLRGRARSWPRDLGEISTLDAHRAASMPEANEHEAHPPPTSSPRIYAVERGHGRETSGEISPLAARRAASMPEADEHEAHVEPEADELGPASTRPTSSPRPTSWGRRPGRRARGRRRAPRRLDARGRRAERRARGRRRAPRPSYPFGLPHHGAHRGCCVTFCRDAAA